MVLFTPENGWDLENILHYHINLVGEVSLLEQFFELLGDSVEFVILENSHITDMGVFQYPNDPDLDYIAETSNMVESIYLYPHNIIAFTSTNSLQVVGRLI